MLDKLGIERVTIGLPFQLDHVHCFIAEGEAGWSIIDTGLHTKESKKAWESHVATKEVNTIYLTHYHPDHLGYAGELQQLTKASILMSEVDAVFAEVTLGERGLSKLVSHYQVNGIPEDELEEMVLTSKQMLPLVSPLPTINHFLQEGDVLKFGRLEYEVLLTPGHSDGLICLYNAEEEILLSTDHILPSITPNISYYPNAEQDPLDLYLTSLQKLKELPIQLAIPSHGEPFMNVHERIREIQGLHHYRLESIYHKISEPKSAFSVCKEVFKRDLSLHEMQFAMGETLSHLEYLTNQGKSKKWVENSKIVYEAV